MLTLRSFEISGACLYEAAFRLFLTIINIELESVEPFIRTIHDNELWLYKYPRVNSYVSTTILWPLVFILPVVAIAIMFVIHKEKSDVYYAILAVSLALGLNGIITNGTKVIVGRPRPDFFWRCFPDGEVTEDFECTGDPVTISDGRKSFPSGHSSFAFASFGFIALYVAGKLHTFTWEGKTQSWRLCLFLLPLSCAFIIAISRTCDYHHHWQDVLTGSTIGFLLAYLSYRHYYPPLNSSVCHKPYASLIHSNESEFKNARPTKTEVSKWI